MTTECACPGTCNGGEGGGGGRNKEHNKSHHSMHNGSKIGLVMFSVYVDLVAGLGSGNIQNGSYTVIIAAKDIVITTCITLK